MNPLRKLRAMLDRRRLNTMDWVEYAAIMKRDRVLHAQGENCSISPFANITDPDYVAIGSNVLLSVCNIFGHDGSLSVINRAYGLNLDTAGKVVIGDDVFVGHGVFILPGVTIGSKVVIAAGSIVTKDVPDNAVVAGIPAKVISTLDAHVERLKARTETLPWKALIDERGPQFDPAFEPRLRAARIAAFFGNQASQDANRPG